jgi:pantoate--beta-alanine ligase
MYVIEEIKEIRQVCDQYHCRDKSIGFVPTMGALHHGHLALVHESIEANDVTVVSIFVNPLQFNDSSDFEKYPVTIDKDQKKLEAANCDILFLPDQHNMYPEPVITNLDFGDLSRVMEGQYRNGHFNGVAVVILKLLQYIRPDRMYMGLKDFQQFRIVDKMVSDLSIPTQVIGVPTVREEDGLAMSSRNARLSPAERKKAASLYGAMQEARNLYRTGHEIENIKERITAYLKPFESVTLEYFEFADHRTLKILEERIAEKYTMILMACYIGQTRLIDNLMID